METLNCKNYQPLSVRFALSIYTQIGSAPLRLIPALCCRLLPFLMVVSLVNCQLSYGQIFNWSMVADSNDYFDYYNPGDLDLSHLSPKAKEILSGFKPIAGGTFLCEPPQQPTFTPADSTLYVNYGSKKVGLGDFAISKTEVTNLQYRQYLARYIDFIARMTLAEVCPQYKYNRDGYGEMLNFSIPIDWNHPVLDTALFIRIDGQKRIDKQKLTFKSFNPYPDSTVWLRDSLLIGTTRANELCQYYFSSPGYDNYPVVGVSRTQALVYIQWLNTLFDDEINRPYFSPFRLPTEMEWEFAAYTNSDTNELGNNKLVNYSLLQNTSNLGKVMDQNSILLKAADVDGALFTSPIGHFPANERGLFDLQGNVAEWVSDCHRFRRLFFPSIDTVPFSIAVLANTTLLPIPDTTRYRIIFKAISENVQKANLAKKWNKKTIESAIRLALHNNNVDARIYRMDKNYRWPDGYPMDSNLNQRLRKEIAFLEKCCNNLKLLNKLSIMLEWNLESYCINNDRDTCHWDDKFQPYCIKGGSWADSPIYSMPGTRVPQPDFYSDSRTGFRVAMDLTPYTFKVLTELDPVCRKDRNYKRKVSEDEKKWKRVKKKHRQTGLRPFNP